MNFFRKIFNINKNVKEVNCSSINKDFLSYLEQKENAIKETIENKKSFYSDEIHNLYRYDDHVYNEAFINCISNKRMQKELRELLNFKFPLNTTSSYADNEISNFGDYTWYIIDSICFETFYIEKNAFLEFIDVLNKRIENQQEKYRETLKQERKLRELFENSNFYTDMYKPTEKVYESEYNLFAFEYVQPEFDFVKQILKLPYKVRLHFVDTLRYLSVPKREFISLLESTYYRTRSDDFNIELSSDMLYKLNIFNNNIRKDIILQIKTKNELLDYSYQVGIDIKKSWKKDKIIEVLYEKNFSNINNQSSEYIINNKIVSLNNILCDYISITNQWKSSIFPLFNFFLKRYYDVII